MKLAETLAQTNTACLSRKCAAVIVDDKNRIVSLGYNGPPKGIPHCDTKEYYDGFLTPLMTPEEKGFLDELDDLSGACPRKLLGCKSGEKAHYCACLHAEQNAILNAGQYLYDCHIIVYGGFSCDKCAAQIVQVGIKYLYYKDEGYPQTPSSLWLLKQGGVNLIQYVKSTNC